tara:strand:+ start:370 stop:582 length:213 start_codon:yes stop_codon:yes gene_type:complete
MVTQWVWNLALLTGLLSSAEQKMTQAEWEQAYSAVLADAQTGQTILRMELIATDQIALLDSTDMSTTKAM